MPDPDGRPFPIELEHPEWFGPTPMEKRRLAVQAEIDALALSPVRLPYLPVLATAGDAGDVLDLVNRYCGGGTGFLCGWGNVVEGQVPVKQIIEQGVAVLARERPTATGRRGRRRPGKAVAFTAAMPRPDAGPKATKVLATAVDLTLSGTNILKALAVIMVPTLRATAKTGCTTIVSTAVGDDVVSNLLTTISGPDKLTVNLRPHEVDLVGAPKTYQVQMDVADSLARVEALLGV